jgi:hypothetical protein
MTGCPEQFPEADTSIRIVNQSKEVIVWCGFNESMGDISKTSKFLWGNEVDKYTIHPSDTAYDSFYSGSIQTILERGGRKYYLFNYDSVMTIPWERIRDERIILKEVTFHSWEEMEAADFTITYP